MKYLKYFESKHTFDSISKEIFGALVELEDMGFIIAIEDYGSPSENAHIYKEPGEELSKWELSNLYEIQIYKPQNEYFDVKDTIDSLYSLVSYMEGKYDFVEYHLVYKTGDYDNDTEPINDHYHM